MGTIGSGSQRLQRLSATLPNLDFSLSIVKYKYWSTSITNKPLLKTQV